MNEAKIDGDEQSNNHSTAHSYDKQSMRSTITSPLTRSTSLSNLPSPRSLKRPLKRPVSSPVIASPEQAYQHVISSPFHPKRLINQSINQSNSEDTFDLTAFQADYNLTMLKVDLLTQPFTGSRIQSAVSQSINQSINPFIRSLHTPQPDISMRARPIHHQLRRDLVQSRSMPHSANSASEPISGYSSPVYNQLMKQTINHTNHPSITEIAKDYENSVDGVACHLPRFVYEEKLRSLLAAMETIDVRSPVAFRSVVGAQSGSQMATSSKARYVTAPSESIPSQSNNHQASTRKKKLPPVDGAITMIPESTGAASVNQAISEPVSPFSRTDNILNAKRVKLLAMAAPSP